jgi:hypothetical protein
VAYQPRPTDCFCGIAPRISCHGVVLRVVRIVEQVFVGGYNP